MAQPAVRAYRFAPGSPVTLGIRNMNKLLIASLLVCTQVLAGTTLYKFSGTHVHSTETGLPENMTVSDVLNLTNSTTYAFPEFYFSDDGIYGSTNWTRFPGTELPVGSEVTLGIDKKFDDRLYLHPFGFAYRCLLDWDQARGIPKFDYEKHTLTVGQYVPVGKSFILAGSKQIGSRKWVIFHINEISTPMEWSEANNSQKKVIEKLLDSLKSNDAQVFMSVWSKLELEGVADWPTEKALSFVKADIQNTFGSTNINLDKLKILYTGGTNRGTVKLVLDDKAKFYDLVEEEGSWKIGK